MYGNRLFDITHIYTDAIRDKLEPIEEYIEEKTERVDSINGSVSYLDSDRFYEIKELDDLKISYAVNQKYREHIVNDGDKFPSLSYVKMSAMGKYVMMEDDDDRRNIVTERLLNKCVEIAKSDFKDRQSGWSKIRYSVAELIDRVIEPGDFKSEGYKNQELFYILYYTIKTDVRFKQYNRYYTRQKGIVTEDNKFFNYECENELSDIGYTSEIRRLNKELFESMLGRFWNKDSGQYSNIVEITPIIIEACNKHRANNNTCMKLISSIYSFFYTTAEYLLYNSYYIYVPSEEFTQ